VSAGELAVLAPVLEGREAALRRTLEALPDEDLSPLARVRGLHFSRWVIVPDLVYGAEPQKPDRLNRPLLVFTSTFDGSLEEHLGALLEGLGDTADAVWGHCDGWPGRGQARDWLLRHRVRTGLFVAAYPRAPVDRVRSALAARERLLALAEETQGADTETLRRRFVEEFAP
jgi:hypothetical protein